MIDAVRMEMILGVYIKDKIFVESNQCLTFFAPAIRDLFKKSKFIHVVRHPGDFVRSALKKGWHRNDTIWETGRVKRKNKFEWDEMDQIEKLAWVWQVTNSYIANFKKAVESDRIITFRIEDLFKQQKYVNCLLKFINAKEIALETIEKIQNTKINELIIFPNETPNMKKIAYFPKYNDWDGNLKNKIKKFTERQAELFEYNL
jgi:hypothetical protein